ncbi:MAG: carbon-nitrogen hydrolase family protein [Hyphomicrobiales bacterium]|jgi:predicted amidohydrolase|nr:MAG: carbon-nitrogen hydrolase family protein [Hyphomicrobiales bacterium]
MTRVYIVQRAPHLLDLDAGTQTAIEEIGNAAERGANLVVFPETWLGGYPAWVFGMAGWNDEEARRWFGKLAVQSAVVGGPHIRAICGAARDREVTVVLGFNERARPASATLFNSAITIGADGSILGVHRKLLPTHTERLVWTSGDAAGLHVHDTAAGRVGSLVCWEHFHPIIRQALHAEDEEIHVALWPDMTSPHEIASRHYAIEGRCFVVSAATYLPEDAIPEDLRAAYAEGVGGDASFPGGSSIIGPDGEYRIGPVYGNEPVVADINLHEAIEFKHDLDVVGHYNRFDIIHWSIDRLRSV